MKVFKLIALIGLIMPTLINGGAVYAQEEYGINQMTSTTSLIEGEQAHHEENFDSIGEEKTLEQEISETSEIPETNDSTTTEVVEDTSQSSTEVLVTFLTAEDRKFLSQDSKIEMGVIKGETIAPENVPKVELDETSEELQGWEMNGQLISDADVSTIKIEQPTTFRAVVKEKEKLALAKSTNGSISAIINQADKTKLIIVPDPSGTGEPYKEYASTDDGLRTALADLYHNGEQADFTMYIGTNFTVAAGTTAKIAPPVVDKNNVTFYSLEGRVNSITLTGEASDPINNNNTALANAKTLTFPATNHFGSDLTIRNLNYRGTTLFMNGHNLFLNGGSSGNGLTIYGGTDNGNVNGSPTIEVNSTGSGTWNFYGGNQAGGTLTGNVRTVINQTTRGIGTLSGGANEGTIVGDTHLEINGGNGTITTIYGGGVGTNATRPANVTGRVSTTIQGPSGTGLSLGNIYGGVSSGNIGGSVATTISGNGSWASNTRTFVGGSENGNIGSTRGADAIVSNLNTSQFTGGRAEFIGANRVSGTITGNISSTLTAGSDRTGGFNEINGGAGNDVGKLRKSGIGASNEAIYDAYSPAQRAALAESSAAFKVYGNISTYLVSGSFSNGNNYSTAAGRGGYIEGNTLISVGTANSDGSTGGPGMAYTGSAPTGLEYSTTQKNRGNRTNWDIVGGGGYPATNDTWDIYIKGNTDTVINNAVARWTYGGGYSGVIDGNSSNTMHGGIVDTFEGTGYNGARVYGKGTSTVHNGQVDWFLTGGSWNDAKVVGDVSVVVYDGTINASMGASYGVSSSHVITGNSNNVIYGGDFSGTPRTGSNGFSGGITNNGSLLGNSNLTIDLREYEGTFKLPGATSISGGVPYGAATNLGTNTNNTITLNIFTKPGTDVLNGANIYGDGGGSAGSTKSGKITMNIDAPGSRIGNLYATNYSNINRTNLLRDVQANVQRATSINGISGGAANDNFTTAIANGGPNKARFVFGETVTSTQNQKESIDVTGTGIVNFTNLEIKNQTKVMANGGNILNGRSATAVNHGATYAGFGDILLKENSGIGIRTGGNFISAGKLTIEDEASVTSVPGTGKINISDFIAKDDQKDRLTWIKADVPGGLAQVASNGTWFGSGNAYQVLTINPTANNASKVTPFNFKGIDEATGKTFIGDNDLTKGANGYGIAIPGSVIDYEVGAPIQGGLGDIRHNATQVTPGNTPTPIKVWGTEVAGKPVQKGRLIIPMSTNILPKLTFTPEQQETGSWFYSGEIVSSTIGGEPKLLQEQNNSNPVDWTSPDGEYSYTVKVQYSNKAELAAKDVILTETEASAVKNSDDVAGYTKVQGRPFLKDDVTKEKIAEINQPLEPKQIHRSTKVTYKSGTAAPNQVNQTVNLVVVKDGFELSENRLFGVYAENANLKIEQANGLLDHKAMENEYTKALVVLADGTTTAPASEESKFLDIKNTVESELLKSVNLEYSYTKGTDVAKKSVVVKIVGILEITEVPTTFNFGEQAVSTRTKTYWPEIEGNLVVKDTRGTERKSWQLLLKEVTPLAAGTKKLENSLSFVDHSIEKPISDENIIVETYKMSSNGEYVVTDGWGKAQNKGIKLTVPVKKQKVGDYTGSLQWSLVDAPTND